MSASAETRRRDAIEERAQEIAAEAYHDDPRHPSSCDAYREHANWRGAASDCPCTEAWTIYLDEAEREAKR